MENLMKNAGIGEEIVSKEPVQQAAAKKIRPFNVMDQMVAHRLAMEGFEILSVIPSNKYAKEAHFIFSFNSNNAFQKRFKDILTEVEQETTKAAEERKAAEDARLAEATADLTAEIERLNAENEKFRCQICAGSDEKEAENAENCSKTGQNCTISDKKALCFEKKSQNKQITAETFESGLKEILDKLATLEAISNCTLSNVSAIGFFERLHKSDKEG